MLLRQECWQPWVVAPWPVVGLAHIADIVTRHKGNRLNADGDNDFSISYDKYIEVGYGKQGGAWHHQYVASKNWDFQTLSTSGQDANAEMCYQCSETNSPPAQEGGHTAPATNPDRVNRRRYGCPFYAMTNSQGYAFAQDTSKNLGVCPR